jgi:hypothetical protein
LSHRRLEPYNRFVPKKARQAHIPQQVVRRRRLRRPNVEGAVLEAEPSFADEPAFVAPGAAAPVEAPPQRRRLETLRQRQSQEGAAMRVIPGQLPTFERAYLVRELKTIGLTAGSLLALIIALTIVLR